VDIGFAKDVECGLVKAGTRPASDGFLGIGPGVVVETGRNASTVYDRGWPALAIDAKGAKPGAVLRTRLTGICLTNFLNAEEIGHNSPGLLLPTTRPVTRRISV
jgi:hypothetical protein